MPTRNEAGNIELLLDRVAAAVGRMECEVVFVDDSTDETPDLICSLANEYRMDIRLVHRPADRRTGGLGGAVVEGLRVARGAWACVMDADLQHPPELIPQMLLKAQQSRAELVMASRHNVASINHGLSPVRVAISYSLDAVARLLFPAELRKVSDPLTGFFLLRREAIEPDRLQPRGFKILMEILVRFPKLRRAEIPFEFGERYAGRTKASPREVFRYLELLLQLRFGPQAMRFGQFALAGASGLLVNSLLLFLITDLLGVFYLLAAVAATLGSTSWNFGLTELWIYGQQRRPGWGMRYAQFLAMNTLALALRGPILYGLTSLLGVNYLISNLASLAALTLLRFALADRWIWSAGEQKQPAAGAVMHNDNNRRSTNMPQVNSYDIHGIITVVSDARLPELERFRRAEPIAQPTIRVHLGKPPAPAGNGQARRIRYDEGLLGLGFWAEIEMGQTIHVRVAPLLRFSPHVLYTNVVEPILRWAFVERGYALVHGASIVLDGKGYLITARTDTGKTTSLLRILSRQQRVDDTGAFISDDLTLVSPDGQILTYPKPLTISHHTVQAINAQFLSRTQRLALLIQSRLHSRSGRRIAHDLSKTRLPMATINAIVQFVVPPPKYDVQQLVPRAKMAQTAKLAGMFVIERTDSQDVLHLDSKEALDTLLSNCEDAYGFPPYHDIKEFLYLSGNRDLRPEETAIIAQALEGLPTIVVRSQNLDWWRRIPGLIRSDLAQDFRETTPALAQPASGAQLSGFPRRRLTDQMIPADLPVA